MFDISISWQLITTLVVGVLYYLYYLKFANFKLVQTEDLKETKSWRGNSLPCFPNGWFKVLNSEDLKKGEVKYVDYCGRNLAVYRGKDNKVYALDAYCPHMSANMALGGTVKNDRGLQCPFHGWVYDGETGNCVVDGGKETKKGEQYAYVNLKTCETKDGSVFKKECEKEIKVDKYEVKELRGQIFVWFHSVKEKMNNPMFEPLNVGANLHYRGETLNFVNTHIQDIPENGSDMKHFFYVHTNAFSFTNAITFEWRHRWSRADDPNLYEIMKLDDPKRDAFRKEFFKTHINEKNKSHIACVGLENYLSILGFKFKFFTLSGLQLGPSLVYLYLDSPFFRFAFQQSVTPAEKYYQKVWHRVYTDSWLPYWLSSVLLAGEVSQFVGDLRIWNNKKYTPKVVFDLSTKSDKLLYDFRTWYGQFYEGCAAREKELEKYDW